MVPFFAYELPERRRGPDVDGKLNRRYTRVFRVCTGDALYAGLAVLTLTPNLPKLGEIYQCDTEYDAGVEVIGLVPEPETADDPTLWLVTVSYSNVAGDLNRFTSGQGKNGDGQGGGGLNENPLSQPPRISWGRVADKDVLYKPLTRPDLPVNGANQNSFAAFQDTAGTPFALYPDVEATRPVLTMVRNQLIYDPNFYETFWNTLSRDGIFGRAPETVKLDFTTAEYAKTNKIEYAAVTFQFSIRDQWLWRVASRGLKYRKDIGGEAIKVGDSVPVKLDQNGLKLTDADPPYLLNYNIYRVLNWEPMNLPARFYIP